MTEPQTDREDRSDALREAADSFARTLAEELGQPKPWWLSKGIIGALGAILSAAAGLAGLAIDQDQATEWLGLAGALAFGVLALVGRAKAQRPVDPRLLPGGRAGEQRGPGVPLQPGAQDDAGRARQPGTPDDDPFHWIDY